ncbi:helix-turn-helix transcriptional regulator [Jiangella aurantiaca]|uniref:Helix-turn-helix transcriptional regulator n=1 Tax=Jiangella aurantiaca TaxID=2530373 RepID=A0A4R5A603_9ACTN|nr:LuxR family transcriptional regulator [Jiangella aurantiaca]TDD67433.1 helix-turn-helix transcriptional regulator [Jiangella aurantiaca]
MDKDVRDALIGRDSEQTRIREVLLRLTAGEGGAVVVEGAAGVGKSALVRAVADDARSGRLTGLDEVTVSSVVAADSERGWPFSGLHLVLSAVVGSLEPEQQRQAARLVDDLTTQLDQTASAYEIAVQVQPVISRVRRPLVIVIDDAHLLDPQSLEVLGFVARRVGTSPLVFLVVVDTAERVPPLLGLPLIRLGELPPTDATELVRRAAGSHTLHSVAARIAARVGGNPRALLDVVGRVPDVQLLGQVELDRHLPHSPVLQALQLPELGSLTDDQRFALLVATGSEDHRLTPLLNALGSPDAPHIAWLFAEHLNRSDGTFTLKRPAVRSIIWQAATMAERDAAHQALAAAYEDSDPGWQLWHLAQTRHDHDDELAKRLERVAAESLVRGEVERSLAFAREAVRLTSKSSERVGRLLQAGRFAVLAGRLDEAVHIARERFRLDTTPEQRADFALLEVRARNLLDGEVATGLVSRHVEEVAPIDPTRAAALDLAAAHGLAGRMEQAEAARFLALAERFSDDFDAATRATHRRTAALLASVSGELDRAVELVEADAAGAEDLFGEAETNLLHATVLVRAERYGQARRLLRAVTSGQFGDSPLLLRAALAGLVQLELRAGRLREAVEAAAAWDRVDADSAHRALVPAYMIRANAYLGEDEAAWERRRQSIEGSRRHGDSWATAVMQAETGAFLLLLGRFDEAMSVLDHARRQALEHSDPSILAVEPDYIEACVRSGELGRARAALAEFELRAERVPTAWARHTVARCRALASEGEDALTLFREAVETATDAVSPVEQARTLLCFGERLRRLGRRTDARSWLQRTVVLAQESGAIALAGRAGQELGAAGGPVAPTTRLADLTDAEQRIATLVASGRRNREIAAELFVSVRTVEAHLGRIFRKLGIRSRTELTGIVVAGLDDDGAGPG